MRGHPQVAGAGIGGEREVEQGRLMGGPTAVIEHVGDRGGTDGAPGEDFGERRVQRGRIGTADRNS